MENASLPNRKNAGKNDTSILFSQERRQQINRVIRPNSSIKQKWHKAEEETPNMGCSVVNRGHLEKMLRTYPINNNCHKKLKGDPIQHVSFRTSDDGCEIGLCCVSWVRYSCPLRIILIVHEVAGYNTLWQERFQDATLVNLPQMWNLGIWNN